MNYFHMTFDQVLESPMQRLIMLAKSIPKDKKRNENVEEKSSSNLLDFARQNNIKIKEKK